MAWAHLPDGRHLHLDVVAPSELNELFDVFGLLDLVQVVPELILCNFDLLLRVDLRSLISSFSFTVYHCFNLIL